MKKRIFITGGTGFFGKSILSMFARGLLPAAELTILSRNPDAFLSQYPEFQKIPDIHTVKGDIRDFPFPKGHYDWVLHAATPAVTGLPEGEMRDIILRGTERTLSFAKFCGAEKFMLASSGSVYGPQPETLARIPENFPCHPVTEYGIAKLEAEQMCIASGLFTLLPRCFAFTGPYLNRNIHFAIGNFIRDSLSGGPIVIRGDGSTVRSYLFADELVQWLFRIFERGKNGRPYHVGSPEGISMRELAEAVRSVINPSCEIQICGVPGRHVDRYIPEITRSETELNLHVRIPLAEAIRLSLRKNEQKGLQI